MIVVAVVALAALFLAQLLVRQVLAADEGTESMKKIAAAVQEGANAYLARQLRTLGSLSLSRSLIAAGLVDRFRVVVFPVITGVTGKERIFDGYPDLSLELIESRTFDGQIQLLEYIPTVLDGPPGVDG